MLYKLSGFSSATHTRVSPPPDNANDERIDGYDIHHERNRPHADHMEYNCNYQECDPGRDD